MTVELFNEALNAWLVLESHLTESEAKRVKKMWEGLVDEKLRISNSKGGHMDDGLHNMDCLVGLARLPAASVDLVFADLPYGRTQQSWDKLIPIEPLWEQLNRVCKPTAPMVFTAVQPFTSLLVCSNLKSFRYEIVWYKNKSTGFLNAKKQPLRAHENVLVFYREQSVYVPQMTDGHEPGHAVKDRLSKTSLYGATPLPSSWGGSTQRYPTTVLKIPVVNGDAEERIHANQKPIDLPGWFIKTYTQIGDLVLDPTAGSGSTAVVAKMLGRRFVGFETDQKMYAAADKRIRSLVLTK